MIIKGIVASCGVIIGKVKIFTPIEAKISETMITNVEKELSLFAMALEKTKIELEEISSKIKSRLDDEMIIFDAHIDIVDDPQVIKEVTSLIQSKHNAAYSYNHVCNKYIDILKMSESEYLRERVNDIKDVCNRVLNNYFGLSSKDIKKLDKDVIIVAYSLNPSELAMFNFDKVKGIITERGGKTSHTAIISRALGIPYLIGVKNVLKVLENDEIIIMDTNKGILVVNPTPEELNKYAKIIDEEELKLKLLQKYKDFSNETKDGRKIMISSNINYPMDIDLSINNNVNSIGLYRTEYLFINCETLPSEENQFVQYSSIFQKNQFKRIVFRTLDISNDKNLSKLRDKEKVNIKQIGRGLEFTLNNIAIFKHQLKALLRTSIDNVVNIMYPYVESIDDLIKAKRLVQECKTELISIGIPNQFNVYQGIMVETLKSVENIDDLVQISDFISIGTNDLLQDFFQIDRDNQEISQTKDMYNPNFIKILHTIIETAHKYNKKVSMCGEMASDKYALPILIGLGLDEFSMNPANVLNIRKILSQINSNDLNILLSDILQLKNPKDVKDYIIAYYTSKMII